MNKKYIININSQPITNDNEVHLYPREKCDSPNYPLSYNQRELGSFDNCKEAVAKAKSLGFDRADGCAYCSKPCHTS